MNCILIRNSFFNNRIIGDLLINHRIFCHTCEFLKKSPVLSGRYKLSLYSIEEKEFPVLARTNGIGHIRIYGSNSKIKDKSSIMVGYNLGLKDRVWGDAEEGIVKTIKNSKEDSIFIEIINAYPGVYKSGV